MEGGGRRPRAVVSRATATLPTLVAALAVATVVVAARPHGDDVHRRDADFRARLLHAHQPARRRQVRWVVPMLALLAAATLATLAVQYRVSDQTVGTEFFRAHKTISHTGELLQRGFILGAVVLGVTLVAVGVWALRLTHRIVAPLHTLHHALDAIMGGDLG